MDYDPTKRALLHPEDQDPTPGFGLGWRREQICAELSRLAYYRFEDDNGARLASALRGGGFGDPRPFVSAGDGAQGFATIGDGVAYVAFRGTQPDSLHDLLADARFRPAAWPGGGQVHRGFLRAFEALHRQIDDWLGGAGRRALIATGHSLGAAMATLMAAAYPEAELISFGSPRVGDRAFAGLFAGRQVQRFVDCADMVTRVPPDGMLGYVPSRRPALYRPAWSTRRRAATSGCDRRRPGGGAAGLSAVRNRCMAQRPGPRPRRPCADQLCRRLAWRTYGTLTAHLPVICAAIWVRRA